MASHPNKRGEFSAQRATFVAALAKVSDPQVAAALTGYGHNAAVAAAKDPHVIKAVEAIRFKAMSEKLVPMALTVVEETLAGPAGRARDEMARWTLKEWKDEHASAGADGEEDASAMSSEALARRIRELELQAAALETIKAGQAIDVTPSQDVIEDAEPITDVDPFD